MKEPTFLEKLEDLRDEINSIPASESQLVCSVKIDELIADFNRLAGD